MAWVIHEVPDFPWLLVVLSNESRSKISCKVRSLTAEEGASRAALSNDRASVYFLDADCDACEDW